MICSVLLKQAIRIKKQLRNHLGVVVSHQLSQLLRRRSNGGLSELAQCFKVAQIERRRKRVEKTSRLVRRVAECMDGSNRHHHERALTGPHYVGPSQKLQFAFQDVKALFMGMMDMRRRCGSMRRHFKFRDAQCSPRMRPILLHHHMNRTERKRASFSRLQYDGIHENILSCLACSNKQGYKHLSRTWRSGQNRHRDEVFPAVLTRCELHYLCFATNSQGEACS